jgi:predicted nucleotidyltransferase
LITEHRSEIAALCRRFGVRRLAVFGSAGRNRDFDPRRSDIDFVVAFERADAASLNEFLALRDALSASLGRPVDLVAD